MITTRACAQKALHEIFRKEKKPKDVLESLSVSLDGRERAFLMELVYGVVRHRDTLDWVLNMFLKNPSGLSPETMNNLRLAAYQILFLRVPEWAAVHEAVTIEKDRGRPSVVNAVLRNLLRSLDTVKSKLKRLGEETDPQSISLATSHPEWLIKRWISRFGEREAKECAEANNLIPPLTLRVNTLRATRASIIGEFVEKGIRCEPTSFSPVGINLRATHSFSDLPHRDSLIVQDEASQLIAYLLEPRPGERVLDSCAAPGGKTTHIAQLMNDRGEIVAVDNDNKRITRLRENVSTLGISSVGILEKDVIEYSPDKPFDRILLDAPCSSLGVIRRNPDIKYRHTPGDLQRFKARQGELLRTLSRLLKPGGTLVYSVCSPEPEEGSEVVKEFLKDSEEFYIIDTGVSFLKGFMEEGFFRTYPHKDDMDGFFGVRLCKKA